MTVKQIQTQYKNRQVIYFLGEKDNDPNGKWLARNCAAMLQGSNRLERGIAYYNHLRQLFGQGITVKQKLEITPNVGHSPEAMFNSNLGIKYLFDYDLEVDKKKLPSNVLTTQRFGK